MQINCCKYVDHVAPRTKDNDVVSVELSARLISINVFQPLFMPSLIKDRLTLLTLMRGSQRIRAVAVAAISFNRVASLAGESIKNGKRLPYSRRINQVPRGVVKMSWID